MATAPVSTPVPIAEREESADRAVGDHPKQANTPDAHEMIETESDYSGSPCSMIIDPEEQEEEEEEGSAERRPSPPPKRVEPQACEFELECPICVSLFSEPVSPRTSLAAYCIGLRQSAPKATRDSRPVVLTRDWRRRW